MSPFTSRRHSHLLEDCKICLVRPSYPENVGAVARAMQITGFKNLVLVDPDELASPQHPNALKMAVGSHDILEKAKVMKTLQDAIADCDVVIGTSGRAGVKGVFTPRDAATKIKDLGSEGKKIIFVFGGEKDGLRNTELELCTMRIRIPMAGSEPSYNLAQAAMVILYECFVAGI